MSGESFCGVVRSFLFLRGRHRRRPPPGRRGASTGYPEGRRQSRQPQKIGNPCLLENFFIRWHFQRLFHVDKLHLHFLGTAEKGGAFAAGDATGAQAGGPSEGKALAVVGVKGFDFEGGTVGCDSRVTPPLSSCHPRP